MNQDIPGASSPAAEVDAARASWQRSLDDALTSEERSWRTLVRSLFPNNRARNLIGVSSLEGAGSTNTLVANLSTHAADYLKSAVLVVEAHRTQPPLADSLGAPSAPGLGDLLASQAQETYRCIHRTCYSKLWVMPFARAIRISDPRQLEVRYRRVYSMLPPALRAIVVALPPIHKSGDIPFPCSTLDRIVLAVRPNSVASGTVRKAIDRLSAMNATVAGVIWVNGSSRPFLSPSWLLLIRHYSCPTHRLITAGFYSTRFARLRVSLRSHLCC
jgi:Mrp family chromosome partitioning ATPase